MAGRTTLDKWIADAINDPDKDGRKISQIMLVHMQGTQQQELHTFKFAGVQTTPKELADMFRGKAETYSQDLEGRQMFQLLAYYGTAESEARHPFVVQKAADPTAGGLMTEPPDATGQTMQMMRHKESAHTAISGLLGQVYARQQAMDNHSLRMIEQLSTMNNHLTAENFQNFGMIKELLFKLADDTHKQRMDEMQFQRASETRKKLIGMVPALANTLTGREVFPLAAEDTAIVESVAENITEKQIEGLMQLGLPPELLGMLASRVQKHLAKKREEQEERARLPAFRGTAEADIGGGDDGTK